MKSKLYYPILISFIVFIIYALSLFNGFVWLDEAEILNKKLIITDWASFIQMFFSDDNNYPGYHRPMYNLMHSFDYLIWKDNAFGFHLSSLILHIVNSLLLFVIVLNFSKRRLVSLWIALVFGLLPCHTATVGLIHSKADLLACLFILLPIYGFSKFDMKELLLIPMPKMVLWSLFFVLALLSKEVAIMFPFFMIGVYFLAREEKFQMPAKLPIFLTVLGVLFLVFRISATSVSTESESIGFLNRMLTFIPVYVGYFTHTLTGFELTTNDAVKVWNAIGTMEYTLYFIVFFGLLTVQYYFAKKNKVIAAGFLWYNLFLIPVAQIIPILHFRADRFLYIPSIGLIVALAYITDYYYKVYNWKKHYNYVVSTFSVLLVIATFQIVNRINDFSTNETLFGALIETHPECREAQSFVGNDYLEKGDFENAFVHISKALTKQEDYDSFVDEKATYGNLGVIYMYQDQIDKAIEVFSYLKTKENYDPEVVFNLGICYKKQREFEQAKVNLMEYLKYKPNNTDALFNLGAIGVETGDQQMTKDYFSRYLQLNPNSEYRSDIEQLMGE